MLTRLLTLIAFSGAVLVNPGYAQVHSQGRFQLSEAGAATYSIPIQLAPGVSGVEPQLSLNYSSQSGNGLLGIGWSVGGLGAVTRCPRTFAQDGLRGGVNYDLNDRYCLDGQRLVAINGDNGQDGTEYRTERESFARIISYGSAGNGPAWFKVWTKSGQIMEYGKTFDARVEAAAKASVRTWALNRVEDTSGNFFAVSYKRDLANGDYYPSRIEYTGNSKTNKAAVNTVLFQYEDRPDIVLTYRAGSVVKNSVRLKSISNNIDSAQIKVYNIAYKEDADSYSRIANISECVAGVCRGKFSFDWTVGTTGFRESERFNTEFTVSAGWFSSGIHDRVWVVDVNGDGLPDILGATDSGLYWQLNTGGSFGAVQHTDTIFRPSSGWFDLRIQNRVWITDVNGDGLPDILGATDGGLYWQLNTGNGFASVQRADTSFKPSDGWFVPSIHNRVWVIDINGDGLPDILGATDSGLYWQLNTGGGFGATQRTDTFFRPSSGWFDLSIKNRVWIVDVNGDGLPDILGATNSGLYWQLNTGSGFDSEQHADTSFKPSDGWFAPSIHNRVWIADVNGDGLPDILGATDSGLYWQLNIGNGFGSTQRADTIFRPSSGWFATTIHNRVWVVDANGDGTSGILGATDSGLYLQRNTAAVKMPKNLIVRVTDEVGNVLNITYAPLTNKNTYAKDKPASQYPVQDVQLPIYVVAEVSSSGADGSILTSQYTYGGLKVDSAGRGSLGFRWMQAKQMQTGLTSYTEYQQAWPYTGLPGLVRKSIASGGNSGVLSQTVNTYGCNDPSVTSATACTTSAGKRYFVYAKQSMESRWDYNGTALPVITTTTAYDNWGNATKVDVATNDGFKKSTVNTYANDSVNWYLGRLQRSSVTSTSP